MTKLPVLHLSLKTAQDAFSLQPSSDLQRMPPASQRTHQLMLPLLVPDQAASLLMPAVHCSASAGDPLDAPDQGGGGAAQ
jgi:hypothetical protein